MASCDDGPKMWECINDEDCPEGLRVIRGVVYEGDSRGAYGRWGDDWVHVRVLGSDGTWAWHEMLAKRFRPWGEPRKAASVDGNANAHDSTYRFFAAVEIGECPCKIPRADCRYHQ